MNGIKTKNQILLDRLKNGDMLAFDSIYKQYFPRLFSFVLKLIKHEVDAEGIVQEVFIKVWELRDGIDSYSSFDSYLFTIAYNNTISLLRKRVNEKKYLEHLKSIQQTENSSSVLDEIHYKELKSEFTSIINKLTPKQKEVFILSREEGLTYKQIAKKLNISQNTVENHMSKALKFLKSNIDNSLLINALFLSLFIL